MLRKNRLDLHHIQSTYLAVQRGAFDKVMELTNFRLRPVADSPYVWEFEHPESRERGQLLDVEGFLRDTEVSLSVKGLAYMVTRQDFTLALVFPSAPRALWLSEGNYKVLAKAGAFPAGWPEQLISKVIRSRLRKVVIIDEAFLLERIGLRAPSGAESSPPHQV